MVLLCCSFFLSTTTSLLAATPEITDLSPEESDSGFEMMLQLRMHGLGIEPAPATYERLCIAIEKNRAEQETVTAQHASIEEEFVGGTAQFRDLERAQHEDTRQEAVAADHRARLKDIMAQQDEREKRLKELAEHTVLLAQNEEKLLQECAVAERNMALLIACREETADEQTLADLLVAGADPNSCDNQGYTAMLLALEGSDLLSFYQLREAGGQYLSTDNPEMQQELNEELEIACDDAQVPAGQLLFSIYMGGQLPVDALPRVMLAAKEYDDAAERVAILCHEPIDVNARDSHGQTALHYAVARYQMARTAEEVEGRKGILEGLLEAGADMKAANRNGKTAYDHYATAETRELLDALCHPGEVQDL